MKQQKKFHIHKYLRMDHLNWDAFSVAIKIEWFPQKTEEKYFYLFFGRWYIIRFSGNTIKTIVFWYGNRKAWFVLTLFAREFYGRMGKVPFDLFSKKMLFFHFNITLSIRIKQLSCSMRIFSSSKGRVHQPSLASWTNS